MSDQCHLELKEGIYISLIVLMHVGYIMASLEILNLFTTVLAMFAMTITMINCIFLGPLILFTSIHPIAGLMHLLGMLSMFALYLDNKIPY